MRTRVILADFPAGAVTSLFIMITAGAILSLCLLIAGVLHTTGNHDDRNRFLRAAKLCVLVGIVLVAVLGMFAKVLDLP